MAAKFQFFEKLDNGRPHWTSLNCWINVVRPLWPGRDKGVAEIGWWRKKGFGHFYCLTAKNRGTECERETFRRRRKSRGKKKREPSSFVWIRCHHTEADPPTGIGRIRRRGQRTKPGPAPAPSPLLRPPSVWIWLSDPMTAVFYFVPANNTFSCTPTLYSVVELQARFSFCKRRRHQWQQ